MTFGDNLRHSIDISPWDKSGRSFFGMKRKNAKQLAVGLIISAMIVGSPPFFPDPSDLINVFIAKYLILWFSISNLTALALSYTLVPIILFFLGIWVYPINSQTIFNGYMNRLKYQTRKLFRNPLLFGVLLITGYYTFKYYLTILG